MNKNDSPQESITFLGTAGARIMVSNQFLASGGIWLDFNGTSLLLDPGPGSVVQVTKRKLPAEKLSAIILSHRHLDHSSDANIMTEAMVQGGFKPHGQFFAPSDALNEEPVLFSYLKPYLDGITLLQEGGLYSVNNVSFSTPLRHIHAVETYGINFDTGNHTLSYISDGRYSDKILSSYLGELLIMNVIFLEPRPGIDHLSIKDAKHIIEELKPKTAILTHFGWHVWKAKPWLTAENLSQETGTRVIAARDGMRFDLSELDGS